MIKTLMRQTNIFSFDNFWKSNGDRSYSSVCGGLVSIPLLVIIVILLVLKLVQMVNYGIVMTNSQITYTYEPPLTTFSTSQTDPAYAPFMLGFSVNIDNARCPNSAITFEAFLNEYSGSYASTNRSLSKVPLNFETCTENHFAMLPGKMGKVNQWSSGSLYCLPAKSYFQIGGSNTTSDLYKNIQYRFACPSSCSVSTCGYVQFFAVSSTVNLGNASSPYSYSLNRNKFYVNNSPSYQTSYQIDSTNMTSDNSIFPFSLNHLSVGSAVGNIVTDIPLPSGDTNTYVTIERSDKNIIYMRSYYKIFDLLAYMGGIINGILILLFFIRNFSRIQFELNFAAEYFRVADSKAITFRGYLKQLFYEIIKQTRWKPDWRMAEERQQSRVAANRVLDVIYLNKRIAFLEEAISLVFQKHQLKGIHLLHNLTKDDVKNQVNAYRFRDRLVYFLGKKYRHRGKLTKELRYDGSQVHKSSGAKQHQNHQIQPEVLISGSNSSNNGKLVKQKEPDNSHQLNLAQEIKYSDSDHKQKQASRPKKLNLKNLILTRMGDQQQKLNINSETHNLIINQAEGYYSELAESEKMKKTMVNSQEDNLCLKNELNFVGDLTLDELNEIQLIEQIQTDMKRLIDEGEQGQGNQISKKIYARLDQWLKNYLRDTVKQHEHHE